ncbi:UDP-N-acetylglucosamine transporter yea4 [Golovinomyces cichoracearum]|uniref:UDP-N-acetylglucosamine transporter yea4 n=1 Tax=Golovinomyces cichoracearum TaxID=62708 RepID=A0A420IJH4_9PEZI|nr:UDP-N-acetylglucosamine transporter yea4 [Golovinomyces cichoracearum]
MIFSRKNTNSRGPDSLIANGVLLTPEKIDAQNSSDKSKMSVNDESRVLFSGIMILIGRFIIEVFPHWLAVGSILGLIFGGCCSNVFALEAIVKIEPDSGTLLTFVQFLFVAVTGYISQFDKKNAPFFIKPNQVPLRRWMVNIVLFFTINVLNNHAFSYNISVPIHIILRSGGSITTLIAGCAWGKRFSRLQIATVILLTLGVIIAAWSDHKAKKMIDVSNDIPPFTTGLGILFVAQVLSAIMGLYTEETYKIYGPHWKENLFYSHLLSLPLFTPFLPSMTRQFLKLAASTPIQLSMTNLFQFFSVNRQELLIGVRIPSQLVYLVTNVFTQYACIRGVNLLAAVSSALTVTIVLNIRKLLSLLLSIWLFENTLSVGTLVGACIVFFAGALYGIEGSQVTRHSKKKLVLESKRKAQN